MQKKLMRMKKNLFPSNIFGKKKYIGRNRYFCDLFHYGESLGFLYIYIYMIRKKVPFYGLIILSRIAFLYFWIVSIEIGNSTRWNTTRRYFSLIAFVIERRVKLNQGQMRVTKKHSSSSAHNKLSKCPSSQRKYNSRVTYSYVVTHTIVNILL